MNDKIPETRTWPGIEIHPVFAWYDMWIGAYWDRKTRSLYVLPIPCVGVRIMFGPGR